MKNFIEKMKFFLRYLLKYSRVCKEIISFPNYYKSTIFDTKRICCIIINIISNFMSETLK